MGFMIACLISVGPCLSTSESGQKIIRVTFYRKGKMSIYKKGAVLTKSAKIREHLDLFIFSFFTTQRLMLHFCVFIGLSNGAF